MSQPSEVSPFTNTHSDWKISFQDVSAISGELNCACTWIEDTEWNPTLYTPRYARGHTNKDTFGIWVKYICSLSVNIHAMAHRSKRQSNLDNTIVWCSNSLASTQTKRDKRSPRTIWLPKVIRFRRKVHQFIGNRFHWSLDIFHSFFFFKKIIENSKVCIN